MNVHETPMLLKIQMRSFMYTILLQADMTQQYSQCNIIVVKIAKNNQFGKYCR